MADVDLFVYNVPGADEVTLRDPSTAQPDDDLSTRVVVELLDLSLGFLQISGG